MVINMCKTEELVFTPK